jgi:aminoglycoside/choline kinase family phosphotransferase
MDTRQQALEHWLNMSCRLTNYQLQLLAGDASFRRYFRVQPVNDVALIAMDAPPEKENCRPFIAIAKALSAIGLNVPDIFHSDVAQGFLLLTDFGDSLYLKTLSIDNAEALYGKALDALAILQSCPQVPGWTVPLFTADFMYKELQLFKEWFLQRYLDLSLSTQTEKMLESFFHFLANTAAEQPQVFMHRDYHSANLMLLPMNQVGILDFQDAFFGPVTYDLVSLLRDCYIAWPDALVTKLVLQYKAKLPSLAEVSDQQFIRWFDLMGMQRHLKALLTFSRKYCRDNDANYLQHIPRTLIYILNCSQRYSECEPFQQFLSYEVMPCVQ